MNRIALGTVQFGLKYGIANTDGQISHENAAEILSCANHAGMDTIDTAVAYGESEQRLGQLGLDGWRVVTKLPPIPDACPNVRDWIATTLGESLTRLGVTSLHGLLLHEPAQLLGPMGPEIHRALLDLKDSGTVTKTGVSVYDPAELDALFEHYPPDLVQAPFNMIDRRLQQSGWLGRLDDAGVELHVRSIFLQGLLLMDPATRSRRFPEWRPEWTALQEWIQQTDLTPLEASVGHALSFPQVERVVVGIDSPSHLQELLEAAGKPAPEVPETLSTTDIKLLNPALWGAR